MPKENENVVELSGFVMPSNTVHTGNASSSLMVGNNYSNGMSVSGVIKRITLELGSGVVSLHLMDEPRRVFIQPSGMMLEEKAPEKAKPVVP